MSVENKRVILENLLDSCPFPDDDNCPLRDMRSLPDEKKQAWTRSLVEEEVCEIIEQHERCFSRRQEIEND